MTTIEGGVFLARALATAGIVIAITLAVERLGARRGGMLAGLPIVLGPGFAALALVEPAPYVAQAAAFALLSLTATQGFMLAYSLAARAGAAVPGALAAAIGAWGLCALVLARIEASVPFALLAFAAATVLSRIAHARLVLPQSAPRAREGRALLLLRGALAGLLVGLVTAGSARLGPALAGMLMAYPVGTTVIAATIHQRAGAATAVATLSAVTLGTTSLAAFATTLALLAAPIGAGWAFAAALAASFAVTFVMMRVAGRG